MLRLRTTFLLRATKLLTLLFFGTCFYTPAQTFQHAKRMGCDKAEDRGAAIAVDRQGNQYTTGYFRSFTGIGAQAADFDPGPAFYPMWSDQGSYAVYISKLDAQGNFVWAKQFAGGISFGKAVSTDAAGNVYITGRFAGIADFDPGSGTLNLNSSQASYDVFVVKLNPSGDLLWAKTLGSGGEEDSNGLVIDPQGNVLVSGSFSGIGDFDPGPDSLFLSAISSLGQFNAFLVKLTSGGNIVWARNMGGYATEQAGLTVDSLGNSFFLGCFYGNSDFNPDSVAEFRLTSKGQFDVFITKLNGSGIFVWTKALGSPDYDFASGIQTDAAGNIYACGSFNGDTLRDVQTGQPIVVNSKRGRNDAFILKMNGIGDILWGHAIGDTSDNEGSALALARDGSVYLAGSFRDSVDFDPGAGKHYLKAKGDPDGFILKLDTAGKFQRVLPISGKRYVFPASLFLDSLQNLYATGWYSSYFSEAIDFDPGPGEFGVTGFSNDDIFVLKLSPCHSSDTLTPTSCKSYSLNGVDYSQSGIYSQNFSTPNGCDSSLILKLKILQPAQSNPTYQLCSGQSVQVGTHVYNSSGIFIDTLVAANGCDSIVTSTLNYSIPNDTLQVNGSGLTAAAGQDSYQWLNCNAGFLPISGETQQTFSPGISGSYAVRVSKGNCVDTSDCVLFTSNQALNKNQVLVYPQPAKDRLYIQATGTNSVTRLEVNDVIGRSVLSQKVGNSPSISISHLPAGIYQLRLWLQNEMQVFRVVIER